MGVLDGIKDLLGKKSAVQMVADDPQMSAELLLLLRTMFADGEMTQEEVRMFKALCGTALTLQKMMFLTLSVSCRNMAMRLPVSKPPKSLPVSRRSAASN